MGINIGRYNQRVTIRSLTETTTASGGVTRNYSNLYTLWAEVVPTSGAESSQNDEKVASRSIICRIRKQGISINEKMQLVWNSQTHDIISIDEGGNGLKVYYEIRAVSKDNNT